MGLKNKSEPKDDTQLLADEEVVAIFEQEGWLEFLKMFSNYNNKLVREFIVNLEQSKKKVRNIIIPFSVNIISNVSGVPIVHVPNLVKGTLKELVETLL